VLELGHGVGVTSGGAEGPDELGSRLCEGAEEDDVGEVDVLEALRVLADAGDEALEVGGPLASLLVEVFVADVD